jgi:tRNA(Ile2) C34 agmatinyltransferase TiaS
MDASFLHEICDRVSYQDMIAIAPLTDDPVHYGFAMVKGVYLGPTKTVSNPFSSFFIFQCSEEAI